MSSFNDEERSLVVMKMMAVAKPDAYVVDNKWREKILNDTLSKIKIEKIEKDVQEFEACCLNKEVVEMVNRNNEG